ncbi:MAG: polysaccharide deacetylase family protein [Bacteroidia bacterium]|nr:polysaccharide deacetylase family protein [Bacteroidia bacterium]MDW8014462.1 polysaccharide deacetylase family protein [Bacteroidia bacterium]
MHLWRLSRFIQRQLGAFLTERPKERFFFLTFDDGPSTSTAFLLSLLGEYNLQATFFWLWSRYHERLVASLLPLLWEGKHQVGLHGLTHLSLWRRKWSSEELKRAAFLWERAGVPFISAFRPPYGHVRGLSSFGFLKLVLWDLMPPDFLGIAGWEEELLRRLRAGDVVVLHEREANRRSWQRLFALLTEEGWKAKCLPLPLSISQTVVSNQEKKLLYDKPYSFAQRKSSYFV